MGFGIQSKSIVVLLLYANIIWAQGINCVEDPLCIKSTLIGKSDGWSFVGSTIVNFGATDCEPVESQILKFSSDTLFIITKVIDCKKNVLVNKIIYKTKYYLLKAEDNSTIIRIFNFAPNIQTFIMKGLQSSDTKTYIDFQLLLNTSSSQYPKLILRDINHQKQVTNYENRFD